MMFQETVVKLMQLHFKDDKVKSKYLRHMIKNTAEGSVFVWTTETCMYGIYVGGLLYKD